jgi:acylphosphatase
MIRKTVHYAGNVQGVGFRMTARSIADKNDVTGYVRNLADGRVELIAEGTAQEVDAVLEAVDKTMSRHIRDTKVDQAEATGQFDDFDIRY